MQRLRASLSTLLLLLIAMPSAVLADAPSGDSCQLVLVKINNASHLGITDCNNIPFQVYLSAIIQQIIPYILVIAMISIVAAGIQYMTSSVGSDTKKARERIIGIITGIIFLFIVGLILNQIAPDIASQAGL